MVQRDAVRADLQGMVAVAVVDQANRGGQRGHDDGHYAGLEPLPGILLRNFGRDRSGIDCDAVRTEAVAERFLAWRREGLMEKYEIIMKQSDIHGFVLREKG